MPKEPSVIDFAAQSALVLLKENIGRRRDKIRFFIYRLQDGLTWNRLIQDFLKLHRLGVFLYARLNQQDQLRIFRVKWRLKRGNGFLRCLELRRYSHIDSRSNRKVNRKTNSAYFLLRNWIDTLRISKTDVIGSSPHSACLELSVWMEVKMFFLCVNDTRNLLRYQTCTQFNSRRLMSSGTSGRKRLLIDLKE